ncbi:MAG: hypothetical protein H0T56_09530 [Pseudaminobacter sp.]|nr:hypothetical protein [Pseudaminobacter sp.]
MIKFIAAAIWICAVTIGAVFYSFQAAGAKPVPEPTSFFGGLDYVNTPIISVPVLKDSAINGYFLTRLVYTVEPEKLNKLSVPAAALIVDEVYSYLYSNPQIDFSSKDTLDIKAFKAGIRDSINARVGDTLVHEILVEQIDFLTKEEIRDNSLRRRAGEKEKPIAEAPAPVH